jgi:periplasmic divalent cation tolerance protein
MTVMNSFLIVMTSLPNLLAAQELGRKLLEKKLAACIQIQSGIQSLYYWEGKLCEEQEVLLSAKTSANLWDEIEAYILSEHPYDLPEVITLSPSQVNPAYAKWIKDETKPS